MDCNIYTTDNVLSAFDIVINKIGPLLFLDERAKVLSNFSVDETSQNAPTKKGTAKNNQYLSLSQEATYINHVFREQMIFHSKLEYTQKLKRAHPFIQEIGNNSNSNKRRNRKGNNNKNNNNNKHLVIICSK